ncbi:MAG: asparagine synthase (glutamine-hydrolyzing) [Acidobacteriota bacterium]
MCGIVGVYAPAGSAPVAEPLLRSMVAPLTHRGPDDQGYWQADGHGLGFCRLSIIDLAGGQQPMRNGDGTIHAVCNGEIYNHVELRTELVARGCSFRSRCDVEVVPHLYDLEGPGFVRRLNGQFALAVVDRRAHRLMLARDHVGIAPLFYTVVDEQLLFASEIKALLRHPGVRRAVDLTGLDQLLTWPGPVSPTTLFAGIHSLPPGHRLILQDGRISAERYWDLDYPRAEDESNLDEGECIARLDDALRAAVRDRLQADVPVGFYLSGGLDSSLIAGIIHDLEPDQPRHSFSITFPDAEIDERRYQEIVAAHVGALHHAQEVDSGAICDRLRAIVTHAEAPLRESYNACSLILSQLANQHGLKVIQTGEGADELFGGYVGYRLDLERAAARAAAADADESTWSGDAWDEDAWDEDAWDGGDAENLDDLYERELRQRLFGDAHLFYEKNYHALAETKRALYAPGVRARFGDFDCLRQSPVDVTQLVGRAPLRQRSYLDFKLRMADHLLADHGDRVAYAHSVEVRYPFLDVRVIEAAKQIPPHHMLAGGVEKAILRKMARRYVPEAILQRPKFSFVAPGSPHLLRHGPDWVHDLLAPDRIRRQGYFDVDVVERLKRRCFDDDYRINQTFEDDLLMIVLTFGVFLEAFDLPDLA